MFWKDNKEIKELFTYKSSNFRSSFRVYPSDEEPITLFLDGKERDIVDIGAGGLSFTNVNYKLGDTFLSVITLPIKGIEVEVEISIIRISDEGTAHCVFKTVKKEDAEAIHQYMLQKQRHELQEKRDHQIL